MLSMSPTVTRRGRDDARSWRQRGPAPTARPCLLLTLSGHRIACFREVKQVTAAISSKGAWSPLSRSPCRQLERRRGRVGQEASRTVGYHIETLTIRQPPDWLDFARRQENGGARTTNSEERKSA